MSSSLHPRHEEHTISPRTVSEGNAVFGTPESKLTRFSPPIVCHKSTGTTPVVNSGQHCAKSIAMLSTLEGRVSPNADPFVSASAKKRAEPKLSATASSFQPSNAEAPVPCAFNVANSSYKSYLYDRDTGMPVARLGHQVHQIPLFSSQLGVTRGLRIVGTSGPVDPGQVEASFMGIHQFQGSRRVYVADGDVLVKLADIRDAQAVTFHIKATHPEWTITYVEPSVVVQQLDTTLPFVASHEGRLRVIATTSESIPRDRFEAAVVDLLLTDGSLYAYQTQRTSDEKVFCAIAEFCNSTHVGAAIERLHGKTARVSSKSAHWTLVNVYQGIHLIIGPFHMNADQASSAMQGPPSTPTRTSRDAALLAKAMASMSLATPVNDGLGAVYGEYSGASSPTRRSHFSPSFPVTPVYGGSGGIANAYGGPLPPIPGSLLAYTPPAHQLSPAFGSHHLAAQNPALCGANHVWNNTGSPNTRLYHTPDFRGLSGRSGNVGRRQQFQSGYADAHHSPYSMATNNHNVVDVERILEGSDVRTTIMLRNIPNKIDQSMLKGIVDETSKGLYDFMYLRIDFANNCNVGYAFINFEDPVHIVNFVNHIAGRHWNRFNSEKVAEVSYATIQGKDCLVQKFRNSSVMLESPAYRPKIFYTEGHPQAGDEEPFPRPDNASKMRRSVENAEHVGLFAPRSGQQYRDEQRRRHSQYDRGTRLAALEEIDFEGSYGMPYGGSPGTGYGHGTAHYRY